MYGWNHAPTKAVFKGWIGSDNPKAMFEVGEYTVEIPAVKTGVDDNGHAAYAEPPTVTYRAKNYQSSDPRATLPGMEIRDGQIRIEINDLVPVILSRLEPADLAKALWEDDSVRSEFMNCLVTHYSSDRIGEKERRDFLSGVKEAVHDHALDVLASRMAKIEYEVSRMGHHHGEIQRINNALRDRNITVSRTVWADGQAVGTEEVLLQFEELDRPVKQPDGSFRRGDLEIAGRSWNEARDFWRGEVLKQFPFPSDAAEASSSTAIAELG